MACADTNRARQTAEHMRRGLLDGIDAVGAATPRSPSRAPWPSSATSQVATPDGLRDVTSAFRMYHARWSVRAGPPSGRPADWLVEVDRFWNVQQGGADPIHHWMTMPMLHFEPPAAACAASGRASCGFHRETPATRVVRRDPLRPDPGVRHLRDGLRPGRALQHRGRAGAADRGRRHSTGAYRNRVQEVHVPTSTRCRTGGAGRLAGPTWRGASDDAFIAGSRATARHAGPQVGGKDASLGEMLAAGLPVPPGFAITRRAYRRARGHESDLDRDRRLLDGLDLNDTAALSERCAKIRPASRRCRYRRGSSCRSAAPTSSCAARAGTKEVPVAVRSSATSEDPPDASLRRRARHLPLGARRRRGASTHVRRCWASLFTDRAIVLPRGDGLRPRSVAMSVGIQKMVHARAPREWPSPSTRTNGDRSQVAIDAAWGFGEAVVAARSRRTTSWSTR